LTVSNTEGQEGAETSPVQLFGPPLPPPTSVYTHSASGGFDISWAEAEVSAKVLYEVVLSPDPQFKSVTCNIDLDKINMTSIRVSQKQFSSACDNVAEYNIAVRTVFRNGTQEFKSVFSKSANGIIMVDLTEPDSIVIKESSAVGTIIGVLVVIIALGAGIAYYAHTNRRMRNRFREFVATHYSSATGHATINHHGLMDDDDDDESPIIRGFNDEEPLVM